MTKLDMLWGNPSFLKGYWDEYFDSISLYNPYSTTDMDYQSSGKEELKLAIKELHYDHQNIDLTNKYIVVGNGATQILKGLFKIHGYIFADPPYYSRFPVLCDIVGSTFSDNDWEMYYSSVIHTIPGNPDVGDRMLYRSPSEMFDLSYNWSSYTNNIYKCSSVRTAVFSFAKATGFASTRIGWAVIEDKKLVEQLEQFIEYDTSGVSIQAQNKALDVLDHINNYELSNVFEYGSNELKNRWESIKSLKLPFEVLNHGRGMFLLAKGTIPEELNVLKGSAMGLSDEYFRLNIGCSDETFKDFIRLYKK